MNHTLLPEKTFQFTDSTGSTWILNDGYAIPEHFMVSDHFVHTTKEVDGVTTFDEVFEITPVEPLEKKDLATSGELTKYLTLPDLLVLKNVAGIESIEVENTTTGRVVQPNFLDWSTEERICLAIEGSPEQNFEKMTNSLAKSNTPKLVKLRAKLDDCRDVVDSGALNDWLEFYSEIEPQEHIHKFVAYEISGTKLKLFINEEEKI